MKIEFFGITFAAAQNIIFFPFLCIAIFCVVWRFRKKIKNSRKLFSPLSKITLIKHFSVSKEVLNIILSSIGLLFLFLSLLQPQWNKREEIVQQEGRELFVAIDISRSMLAEDLSPNRLEFAKQKIKKLVNSLKSERVGLVIFSGSTSVQCPLTSDYSALFMFLDQLDVETISSGTTAIDQPIKKVLGVFSSMPTKKNKILVIFTDGEDFSSNLAGVRKEAAKEGLKIFTLGVGTVEGAPIPLIDKEGNKIGHIKDRNGSVVISRLNEGILGALAKETGGVYIKLQDNDNDIRTLVSYVEKFEKEKFEEKKVPTLEEQYPYFLLVSFVCFAFGWLL